MKTLPLIIVVTLLGGVFYYFTRDMDTGISIIDESADMEVDTTDEMNDVIDARSNDELREEHDEMTPENDSVGDETNAGSLERVASDEIDATDIKEFTIDSFEFGYDMKEIRVEEGDTVVINLTNSDGFHDWVIDAFDVASERIREGETTSVTFVADAVGTYEYYCSVGNHREQGMVGTLIVE